MIPPQFKNEDAIDEAVVKQGTQEGHAKRIYSGSNMMSDGTGELAASTPPVRSREEMIRSMDLTKPHISSHLI
jgi:hypothetical protein